MLLPLVGRVAAGSPILAAEHVEREVGVDPGLFAQTPDYLLKVRGMSMRDAGILEGDLLAVKRATEARNGQIVVARLGDDDGQALAAPEWPPGTAAREPGFRPIVVDAEQEFALEGIAVGPIRTQALH